LGTIGIVFTGVSSGAELYDCWTTAQIEIHQARMRLKYHCVDSQTVVESNMVDFCADSKTTASQNALYMAIREWSARNSLCGKEGCRKTMNDLATTFNMLVVIGIVAIIAYFKSLSSQGERYIIAMEAGNSLPTTAASVRKKIE
jgi:hypothetical protein